MSDSETTGPLPTLSLPVGDVTPAELMKAVFPLVVQAAVQSAAAATAAALQGKSTESTMNELKAAVEKNTEAIHRFASAKETENELLQHQISLSSQGKILTTENNLRWHETIRTSMTSPVAMQLIQMILVIGTGLGLWSQMPAAFSQPATIQHGSEKPDFAP